MNFARDVFLAAVLLCGSVFLYALFNPPPKATPTSYKVEARSGQWKIEHRRLGQGGYGQPIIYYSKKMPNPVHGSITFFEEGSNRYILISGDISVTQIP